MPVFPRIRLDLVFLVGRTTFGAVFWGFCEIILILVSLSANGCGCVPFLLVALHNVSRTLVCWLLSGAGSSR